MSNRHRGFYQDYREGRYDEDYDDRDTLSPQTPPLGGSSFDPPSRHADAAAGCSSLALDSAPPQKQPQSQPELRYDDGELYPRCSFIDEYGPTEGARRWDAAARGPATSAVSPPPPPAPSQPSGVTFTVKGQKKGPKPKQQQQQPQQQQAPVNPKGQRVTAEQLQEMMQRQRAQQQAASPKGMTKVSSTLRLDGGSQGSRPGSRSISPQSIRSSVRTNSPSSHPRMPLRAPIKAAAVRSKGRIDGEALSATTGLPSQQREHVTEDGKHRINVVVVGHVDAGKSTIMGHILYKLDIVPQRVIHKFERDAKASGKQSFHFAWVLDETEEERERGVTMDVAVSYFETPLKKVTLLDCPGHRDFVSNMITGATQADAAVVVVNAVNGEFEAGFSANGQTKEHVMLLRSVGVTQLVVAVNKMDTVAYSKERFDGIKAELLEFLKKSGFKESLITFIPIAGLPGENLTETSHPKLLEWWDGGSLVAAINTLRPPERLIAYPARLCVSDVMKSTTLGTAVGGKIITGKFHVGDKVVLHPANETATIKGIERAARGVDQACAGDNVEIGLSGIDPVHLCTGLVMCQQKEMQVKVCQKIEATLVVFSEKMITKSFQCTMHVQSTEVGVAVSRLLSRLDGKAEPVAKPKCLKKGQTGTVEITIQRPICMELADEFRDLGRFMLRANGETVAAGVVKRVYPLVKTV